MKFLKENSYTLSRLLITQFGMMIFAMVLSTATVSYSSIMTGVSVFSILFYLVLLHVAVWETGAKDVIRMEAGRMPKMPGKGFLLGCIAAVPTLIFLLLMTLGYLIGYGMAATDGGIGLYGVMKIILSFWQAPYLGILNRIFVYTAETATYSFFGLAVSQSTYYLLNILMHFAAALPGIAVTGGSYLLGYHNIRLLAPLTGPKEKK